MKKARKQVKNRFPGKLLWISAQFCVGITDDFGLFLAVDGIGSDHHSLNAVIRGGLEHHVGHDTLHDGAQTAGTGVQLERLLGNSLQCALLELQADTIHLQQTGVLLGQSVLGLGQDLYQSVLIQGIQCHQNGHTTNQLGDNTELQHVMGLYLLHQLTGVLVDLGLDFGAEADALLSGALFDDLLQTIKSTAADEQDVAGVDLDEFLLGVLTV